MILFDKFALYFKHQSGVGRNIWLSALFSVGKLGWNGQPPLASNLHADNAHIPALDDFSFAKLEGERLSIFCPT